MNIKAIVLAVTLMSSIFLLGCNSDVNVVYTNPDDGTTLVLNFDDGEVQVDASYTYFDDNGNKIILEIIDGEINAKGEITYTDIESGLINTIYVELEDGVVGADGSITYIVNQATGETITINFSDEG